MKDWLKASVEPEPMRTTRRIMAAKSAIDVILQNMRYLVEHIEET